MIDIDYQSRTPIYVQIVNEIEKCIDCREGYRKVQTILSRYVRP